MQLHTLWDLFSLEICGLQSQTSFENFTPLQFKPIQFVGYMVYEWNGASKIHVKQT